MLSEGKEIVPAGVVKHLRQKEKEKNLAEMRRVLIKDG